MTRCRVSQISSYDGFGRKGLTIGDRERIKTMAIDEDSLLALGELRGMLAAFAWANGKVNHGYTFSIEPLPARGDVLESLNAHLGHWVDRIALDPLDEWRQPVDHALSRWLFQFEELIEPRFSSSMADRDNQGEIVARMMELFEAGVHPLQVWRVHVESTRFYECAWDDFAILGGSGSFFLHLAVSD